jgi:hypothetical protein
VSPYSEKWPARGGITIFKGLKSWFSRRGEQATETQNGLTSETRGFQVIEKSSCSRRFFYSLLILCFLLTILGCHYRRDAGIPVPEGRIVFDRIAVLPFQQIVPEDRPGGAVRCPLCGTIFSAAKAVGSPETLVEACFLEQLGKSEPKFSLIAGERVAGVYRRVSAASLKTPLRQILCDVGKELGAEGMVIGYVYRFREREGEPFAVKKPASVAFDIHLIRVEDGVLVWREVFDRTQSSLMEDLLQASSWKWVTAEELAAWGMEQVLKTFPGLP